MCEASTLLATQQNELQSRWIVYMKSETGKEHLTDADDDDDQEINETEMLDAELKPEVPIPNNAESQAIYREHQQLAKEYLLTDTKLTYTQLFKETLLREMNPDERRDKQELLKKMKLKEELLELYNNFKNNLNELRVGQMTDAGLPAAPPPTPLTAGSSYSAAMHGVQRPNAGTAPLHHNNNSNNSSNNNNNNDLVAEDGWVFIAPNQKAT